MRGVCLREASAYERCLLMRGVCLREASTYERCPLTRGVRLREVYANGTCPLAEVRLYMYVYGFVLFLTWKVIIKF